ncbi:MAG: hypothetical protein U0I22_04360 [Treponema sp.]|nr:hypothetical protein [Treponema sp.]
MKKNAFFWGKSFFFFENIFSGWTDFHRVIALENVTLDDGIVFLWYISWEIMLLFYIEESYF